MIRFRQIKQKYNTVIDDTPVLKRYLTDMPFQVSVSLNCSLVWNVLYAMAKLIFGIFYRSFWFITLAVYYILLAVIRAAVLHYFSRHASGANLYAEWRRYRLCGILLLVMNLALTGMVILILHKNEGFQYPGYLIYIMALYAFGNVISAVRNVIRYRRYRSPILSAAKVLHLAAALVSMLALETAMLAAFNQNGEQFRAVMSGCTGGGVCVVILIIAVYMICRSTQMLKKLSMEELP